MPTPPEFWRSPRLRPALPQAAVEIPPPPAAPSPPGTLLPILLPLGLMVGVMALIAAVQPGMTSMLILTVPMMLVGGVASVITFRRQRQEYAQKTAERRRKYTALLGSYRSTLHGYLVEQQEQLHDKDPEPRQCLAWATERSRHLWARGPDDDDFLAVRLGLGSQPSTVAIKTPSPDNVLDPDPLIRTAQEFADEYCDVPDVPICLTLPRPGGVGLVGPRAPLLDMARAALLQLAAQHAPDEVKIVAIYPAEEADAWGWLRWLPHTWSDDRRQRFLACDPTGTRHLCASLNNLLNSRKARARDSRGNEQLNWPHHLVILLADESLIENEPLITRLQAEGAALGAHPVFLREQVRRLPRDCGVAARLSGATAHVMLLDQKTSQEFAPDAASLEEAGRFAAALAPIRLRRPATQADIPASLSLLELFRVRDVKELNVGERWRKSATSGRTLATPIGMSGGGEPLVIDLHERAHGPNGLVAGMVGAGKSELLQTLVASLAINYHPHRVAFVLVDYKGGGMAKPFAALPHTLGVITNLQQGNLAVRALTSFQVEAQRRQRLFDESGVNHIDAYQRLYDRGQVQDPLPYLVIIVDEFAEMKTEQPDVAKEFVRIARIGRALGFRLILAMQKPEGIVDGQIEANTRFRLCLRVAQTGDSQAMLRRPDAAYLSGVGRAYFQVGVDEIYDLFQVAWGGAAYDPSGFDGEDPLEITGIALDGARTPLYRPQRSRAQGETTQLDVLVEHLRREAESLAISRQPGIWLPPLAETIPLEEIPRFTAAKRRDADAPLFGWDGAGWTPVGRSTNRSLEPIVGVVDDPKQREQRSLRLNLARENHLAVYGAPGYGATTFIQTLVTSLARAYSPAEVHLYLLDFGGRALRLFERLPHVGAVIAADEPERTERLLRHLLRELERRKGLEPAQGGEAEPLPAIVVMLDNYASFVETNEDHERAEERETALAQIAREGGGVDIHLIVTATSPIGIRYRVSSNITSAVAFHLAETSAYSDAVGRTDGVYPPPIPGRGLIRGNPPLEFQAALPIAGGTDAERNAALVALAQCMAIAWSGPRPAPVRTLPTIVPLADLLSPDTGWLAPDPQTDGAMAVPLGLDAADLTPFTVDLRAGPHFLVSGLVQSGKTSLLQTWLLALATRYAPDWLHFYLLDSRRAGLTPLAGLPHVKAYADTSPKADQLVAEVVRLLEARQAKASPKSSQARSAGGDKSPTRPPTVVVAVDDILDQYDDNTTEESRGNLVTIARQGRLFGFHLLAAGTTGGRLSPYNEPIKTLAERLVGFKLDASDTDAVFSLRLPYRERDQALPIGQGYWMQRGQYRRVQLATAQVGAPALEEWVRRLMARASRATDAE